MLTAEQLSQIRKVMDEEYRLDLLALERLSKYLPKDSPHGGDFQVDVSPTLHHSHEQSQLELVKSVLQQNPNRTWTIRSVMEELQRRGVTITAKSPTVSISSALKKLSDRGVISLVSKGSGREPSIYQFGKLKPIASEEESTEI